MNSEDPHRQRLTDASDSVSVYVDSLGVKAESVAKRLRKLAVSGNSDSSILAPSRASADFVLLACDAYSIRDAKSPIATKNNSFLFCIADRPASIANCAGFFTSMPSSSFCSSRHRSTPYPWLKNRVDHNTQKKPQFLFSFVGAVAGMNHRKQLMSLSLTDAGYLEDTSEFKMFGGQEGKRVTDRSALDRQMSRYAEIMRDSKFILCPRGVGNSSFRLFEAMHAGRVPVVISDTWVPPNGPDWDGCSIRISERDVARIPQILNTLEPQWQRLALNARRAWVNHFDDSVMFRWIGEGCRSLAATIPTKFDQLKVQHEARRRTNPSFGGRLFGRIKRRILA